MTKGLLFLQDKDRVKPYQKGGTHGPEKDMLKTQYSYWGIILPLAYSGFSILLLKGFFDGIPNEFINTVRLDGSSEIGIFRFLSLFLQS